MTKRNLLLVGLIAMLAVGCALQEHKPAYDGWSLATPLPVPNSETAVAELNGKIYVIGGYPSDRKTVATVQVYDSATDKGQIVAPLPMPLNHVMAATPHGKVYPTGGPGTQTIQPRKTGGFVHVH